VLMCAGVAVKTTASPYRRPPSHFAPLPHPVLARLRTGHTM
jgi:hypothetical protein